MTAGADLCHQDIVDLVVREGPECVRELIALGTHFSTRAAADDGEYDLGREGGHSHRRILHASDATGREIMRALVEAVRRRAQHHGARAPPRRRPAHRCAASIRRSTAPSCWGAYAFDVATGTRRALPGARDAARHRRRGKVYLYTSNPDIATGDGVAMAYRAGVPIANMEFFQFHPTCLYHPQAKSFLITRGAARRGRHPAPPGRRRRSCSRYHPSAELAPRDIVARAIDHEMKVHGYEHVLPRHHPPRRRLRARSASRTSTSAACATASTSPRSRSRSCRRRTTAAAAW